MRDRRPREGFTLIELLVVIGIIAVLIAILVPVVGKVRLAATTANVTNEVHKISAAIGNYFNDFQAYPGVLPNSAFATGPSAFFASAGTFTNYTQSEDLVMALRGGLVMSGGKLDIKGLDLDQGPLSFNTVTVQPRKHAYVEHVPSEFPPEPPDPGSTTTPKSPLLQPIAKWNDYPGLTYVLDSPAPEFMDTYNHPRPILYLRANASATNSRNNIVYNSAGKFDATVHYDVAPIQGYLQSTTGRDDFHDPADPSHKNASAAAFNSGKLDATKPWVIDYFSNGSGSSAKGGGYLLIDAGPDRIFGTSDDIIVGAGGGQ